MFNFQGKKIKHAIAEVEALDRSQAVIEFGLDGNILDANENLLKMSGYTLAEIKGKHHSIFVSLAERESARYRDFWASLNRGEFQTTQYKRFGNGGKEVWVHASYAPLRDENGKVVSFIKFATDITAYKMKTMEDAGKITAITRAQAVIEFNMDGTIVTANENFLGATGYSLDQIKGKHHSMFVTPEDREPGLCHVLGQAEPRRVRGRRIQAARHGRQGDLDSAHLQSDPRREWQAVQGGEVRDRRHCTEDEGGRQ